MYLIKIIELETGEVIETLEANNIRIAERIERGVNINLNHSKFYTKIEEVVGDN
jgi:hypothetical protein